RGTGRAQLPHPAGGRRRGGGGGRCRHPRRDAPAVAGTETGGGTFLGHRPGGGAGAAATLRRPARGRGPDRRQRRPGGAAVARLKRRPGRWRWLWRLMLLAMLWLAGVAAWIVWVGQRDQAQPADAIIVLGAAAYDARPSPVFEERIRHGLALYRQGYAPVLLFTGGYGTGARFSESQVARRYALRQG